MVQGKKVKQENPAAFQILPMGDAAVVVQFENRISPEIHRKVLSLAHSIEEHPITGLQEWVVAYSSLTLYYNPWIVSEKGRYNPYEIIRQHLLKLSQNTAIQAEHQARLVEIPVCYGEEFGPDLEFIATHHSLTNAEVIRLHSQTEYLVYMIGFAPGFPYLGGMDERIATPRRTSPRNSIPPGTVGIAGRQTGVYSLETPGGWQLIGRTPLALFDPAKEQPALLQAGDRIKFIPISPEDFRYLKGGELEP